MARKLVLFKLQAKRVQAYGGSLPVPGGEVIYEIQTDRQTGNNLKFKTLRR